MFRKLSLMFLFSIGLSSTANAGFIKQSDSIDYTSTDFSEIALSFSQFNNLGGSRTLDSIEFTLFGEILSTASLENVSSRSASIMNIQINALLGLTSFNGDSLVTTLPSLSRTFNATIYDGQLDFAGTSGTTFTNLYSSNSNTNTITDPNIMALFIGSGTIDTLLSGTADSWASGGGNIFSGFETDARGFVDVIYNFSENPVTSVSEPHNAALLGLGLFGMFFANRKKKKLL